MTKKERLVGCIVGGAIGDAWGSAYENLQLKQNTNTFYFGEIKHREPEWSFTDDTQLTLVTLEALLQSKHVAPESLANKFVEKFKQKKITGIGSSTLKALQELHAGGHWSQVGRTGEYAAGNGAAMRIAPFAFWDDYTKDEIRNFCRITHRNDEAYCGALAVIVSLRLTISETWNGNENLIELILLELPDTNVRDRLIELNKLSLNDPISKAAEFGTNGYVVNSVPFAIFCASRVNKIGIENVCQQIIESGGDTDTNASVAGQIAGALLGEKNIPAHLKDKLQTIPGVEWLNETVQKVLECFP